MGFQTVLKIGDVGLYNDGGDSTQESEQSRDG